MSVNFYCTDAPNVTVTCPYCAEVRAAGPILCHIWPCLDGKPAPSLEEDPDAMGDWNACRVLRAVRVAGADELMGELEGEELREARETLADSLWGQTPDVVRRGARVLAFFDYAIDECLSVSWA